MNILGMCGILHSYNSEDRDFRSCGMALSYSTVVHSGLKWTKVDELEELSYILYNWPILGYPIYIK